MSAFHVSIGVSDLATGAERAGMAMRAERRGARDIDVAEHGDNAVAATFLVDSVDREAAEEVGHAVLDAVEADSCSWTVGVLTSFTDVPAD